MRSKAFFINGGAGRVLCAIPALEKYEKESEDKDFIIVCEGGTDMFKGHPTLHKRAYDHWHKNLFEDKLINMTLVTPEPYRVWEYFNQKCSLAQAFDIEINGKGIRDLSKPTLKISLEEQITAKNIVKEVKEKTKKSKVLIFQPFGRGVIFNDNVICDPTGRSFEAASVINIIKKAQKDFAVILMSEFTVDFKKHGCDELVAMPQNVSLRHWIGIINECDVFLGCDSVGQHIAYALDKPAIVILGSTFRENVSYPDNDIFQVHDMDDENRKYSPIRITVDEVSDRRNEGIMVMNDAIENFIIDAIKKVCNKGKDVVLEKTKKS